MANITTRPQYPNPERPLYTPDADAQLQVVERIEQGREGNGHRQGKRWPDSKGAKRAVHATAALPQPMEQHPLISYVSLGATWGVGKTKAQQLVEHPEDMDPFCTRRKTRYRPSMNA